MPRRLFHRILLPASLFLALLAGVAQAQLAAEVSPANTLYTVQPGGHVDDTVSVRNPGSTPIDLTVLRSDFALTPNGAIHPLPVGSLPTSLAAWLNVNTTSVHLDPGQSQDVRFSIDVPASVAPGTHWGTLLFRTATGGQNGSSNAVGMATVAQVAFVIYVNTGTLQRGGKVSAIALAPAGSTKADGPVIEVSFQNTGNGYMKLGGRLELRTLQGKLAGTYPLPVSASLPGGVATLQVPITPALPSGSYLATAIVDFGTPERIAGQARVTLP